MVVGEGSRARTLPPEGGLWKREKDQLRGPGGTPDVLLAGVFEVTEGGRTIFLFQTMTQGLEQIC